MNKKNQFLLFFGVSFSAIVFAPLFGHLYEIFFGPVYGGLFWVSSSSVFEGFMFSFLLFGSLFSWLFTTHKKNKYWLFYVLPFLLFMLFLGAFEELIISIGLVMIGWILAKGILLIRNKK